MQRTGRSLPEKLGMGACFLVLILMALVMIYPFYYVVIVASTSEASLIREPLMLYPKEFTLDSYKAVLNDPLFVGSIGNSVVIAVVGTAYSLLLTICCAYVLMRSDVKGTGILFGLVLFTMFFSGGLIPTYLNVKNLGLLNSLWAVILPSGINTFYMILLLNSFRSVPTELRESAGLEGANDIVILARIMVPLCMPTLMAILLFGFVDRWNEWYSAMLYLRDSELWPMTYVLRSMLNKLEGSANAGMKEILSMRKVSTKSVQCAAILFTILPIMVIYPFLQRHFAQGIMVGALKG